MTVKELDELAEFWKLMPGVSVLPFDDPFKGEIGFLAFYERYKESGKLCMRHKNPGENPEANDIEEISVAVAAQVFQSAVVTELTDVDEIERMLENVITGTCWNCADDPKRRKMGFINYMPLDSNVASPAFMISLDKLKSFANTELKEKVFAWRAECRDRTMREVAGV